MGPAMPAVPAFTVIALCVIVISLPAVLCHALVRNYWLACGGIWLLSFGCGFAVARTWRFPFDHVAFGLLASLIGLATGMVLGIPFVLYRRGWLAPFWTRLMDRDLSPGEGDIRSQVARLKERQRRWRQRTRGMLGFWFGAGVFAGVTAWINQEPNYRDWAMFSGLVGMGLGIFFGGTLLTRLLVPKPDIRCPQCGEPWSKPNDNCLTWKSCPGCGMEVTVNE